LLEREAPGIAEALRFYGLQRTPFSMLSRGVAGLRGRTLIINLPGSPGAVQDAMDVLAPVLPHALAMARGESGPAAAHTLRA
jgi:molybdopterin biosynthesis enzyme MoaB